MTATRRQRAGSARAAVVRARYEAILDETRAEQAGQLQSWFRVWFQAGEGDEPYIDHHVVRAGNPHQARCLVERHERAIARALGSHSLCSPDSIHAISVDVLPDHCAPGEIDG